jgi:hypothetical protein
MKFMVRSGRHRAGGPAYARQSYSRGCPVQALLGRGFFLWHPAARSDTDVISTLHRRFSSISASSLEFDHAPHPRLDLGFLFPS